jgi:hypothetical protein
MNTDLETAGHHPWGMVSSQEAENSKAWGFPSGMEESKSR